MGAGEFAAEVAARLCVPNAPADQRCPLCDAVLDARGHHAGMCSRAGARQPGTTRRATACSASPGALA
eukprot:9629935-Alexandrium_andersonii.AAC.1